MASVTLVLQMKSTVSPNTKVHYNFVDNTKVFRPKSMEKVPRMKIKKKSEDRTSGIPILNQFQGEICRTSESYSLNLPLLLISFCRRAEPQQLHNVQSQARPPRTPLARTQKAADSQPGQPLY